MEFSLRRNENGSAVLVEYEPYSPLAHYATTLPSASPFTSALYCWHYTTCDRAYAETLKAQIMRERRTPVMVVERMNCRFERFAVIEPFSALCPVRKS